ncbi:MAG: type II toxin-antitoxin system VapC family toxin [Haloarculaceae archaeon]
MYCLDANVWIYYFDAGLDEHGAVRESIEGILASEPLFTTTVLQMEVVHYLSGQLAESDEQIQRFLSLEGVTVAELTERDVDTAADLLGTYADVGIGGRDATVVAAMDRYDISRLLTHDEGLKRLGDRLDWLDVRDPAE